jgi:hypothetical protein
MSRRVVQALLAACLFAGGAGGAHAADEAAWTGSVALPALLDRVPAGPLAVRELNPLDPSGLLPPRCLAPALADGTVRPLLARIGVASQRLAIAEHSFAALAAEDEEHLGTEAVAASYGRFTRPDAGAAPEALLALELAYREALVRRNAARLAHHVARLALGLSTGAAGAIGEALDTESLAWPTAPVPELEATLRRVLAHNPRLGVLARLQARAGAACVQPLGRAAEATRQALAVSVMREHGQLQLALESELPAARLRLALAEARLDSVRAAPPSDHHDSTALHEAQIATAQAVAALNRVRDRALQADLRLKALAGEPVDVAARNN